MAEGRREKKGVGVSRGIRSKGREGILVCLGRGLSGRRFSNVLGENNTGFLLSWRKYINGGSMIGGQMMKKGSRPSQGGGGGRNKGSPRRAAILWAGLPGERV